MKLYQNKGFPNPRRVRIFLAEKGVNDVEFVEIDVAGGAAREPGFLIKNPLAQVPVLELENGTHISECAAISRYFEELIPGPALLGQTAQDNAVTEMWHRRVEDGLMNAFATYFHHATPGLGDLELYQNKEWGEKNRAHAIETMGLVNEQLSNHAFIAGEHYSIADITGLVAVDLGRALGIEAPGALTHLNAWHERVSGRLSAAA